MRQSGTATPRHRRTRRRALVVAVLGLVPSLGATAPGCISQAPPSSGTLPVIQFEGDSITVGLTDDINAHYGATYDVAISGLSGTTTANEVDRIAAQAAASPAIEVINLGTNDLLCDADPCPLQIQTPFDAAATNARYDAFAAEFPPTTCVIFTTISTHTWRPDGAQLLDDHLRTFPHLVDWDAAWQPSYVDIEGDPHPNETGRQKLIELIDAALEGCGYPAPTTSTTSVTPTSAAPTSVDPATTEPPTTVTDPPVTDPPATDPPTTDPPTTVTDPPPPGG